MEAIQIIFVALIVSVIAPLLLALVTGRQQRMNKKQEWERQDELAERAEKAAEARDAKTAEVLKESGDKVANAVQEVAVKAEASNTKVAEAVEQVAQKAEVAQSETRAQLTEIHTLVDGEMTAAREELLEQTELSLTVLKKIVERDEEANRIPHAEDVDAIKEAEDRIKELKEILSERRVQLQIMERQRRDAKAAEERKKRERGGER